MIIPKAVFQRLNEKIVNNNNGASNNSKNYSLE